MNAVLAEPVLILSETIESHVWAVVVDELGGDAAKIFQGACHSSAMPSSEVCPQNLPTVGTAFTCAQGTDSKLQSISSDRLVKGMPINVRLSLIYPGFGRGFRSAEEGT